MKYMKNYNSFIKESKMAIEKNAIIVEKQVLSDFSNDFWSLCMRSNVFTTDEKTYIKENFSNKEVSLIKEEWEWLDKAVDWAKDKGEKMLNFVSDKIKAVKDGIKDFVSSMIQYAKKLFLSMIKGTTKQLEAVKAKVNGGDKLKKQIEALDKEKSANEVGDLRKMYSFWFPGKNVEESMTAGVANLEKLAPKVEAQLKVAEGEAVSSSTTNLAEAEADAKNESLSNIIYSTEEDVLMSFYRLKINEAEEAAPVEKEQKSTGQKCIDWVLGFLGQENLDPEAKTGAKLFWWGKLFLKILATCMSPILKVVEAFVKTGANAVLNGVSSLTAKFGGPNAVKYALLGGLMAGIVGLVYDMLMLFGDAGASTGADTMAIVKKWLAKAINGSLELFAEYKTLKYFLAGFCAGMTIWHVAEEIKHLMHAGHEGHEHGEEKAGEKPAAGGAAPAPAAA